MLAAICHCQKENAQAKQLAAWMAELGPYPNHRILVGRDEKAEPNLFANSGFSSVEEITIIGDAWNHWPESCNNAFRQIAKYVEYGTKEPWLWLEADCVPLSKEWLDKIESEYQEALRQDKVFLGDFVHINQPGFIDHMSGVAVYPGVMSNYAGEALLAHDRAWDVESAAQILPRMHKSKLILHRWKYPPFESWEQVQKRIFDVKPDCVLFHQDKPHSLIPLLRTHLSGGVATPLARGGKVNGLVPQDNAHCDTKLPEDTAPPAQICSLKTESTSTATEPLVDWVKFEQDARFTGPSRESREALVRDTVAILKSLCTSPVHTGKVRKELRAQGVIR